MHNNPLVAPADNILNGPHAVAPEDRVPNTVARYMNQVHDHEATRKAIKQFHDVFKKADIDEDCAISSHEYAREKEGRQNKTVEEAQRLWDKFHSSRRQEMTEDEFKRIARTQCQTKGFDIPSALTRSRHACLQGLHP